ncbi:MAG: hypothetical protein ACRECO_22525, partial [Xanthobacteraceae bacterium]
LGAAALAQSAGGTGGTGTGAGTPRAPRIATPDATESPGTTLAPGTPSPNTWTPDATVGGPSVNPANPQDLIGRSNPQDLTAPRARTPQGGTTGTGTPQIMVPER